MYSKYIKDKIKLYKSLKPCYCSTLNETVYFTADGLLHILYKKRRPRNHNERHYRVSLIEFLIPVISQSVIAIKEIKATEPKEIITWTLQHVVKKRFKKRIIKVILIKEGAGKIKFLSVMEKKHKNKKT